MPGQGVVVPLNTSKSDAGAGHGHHHMVSQLHGRRPVHGMAVGYADTVYLHGVLNMTPEISQGTKSSLCSAAPLRWCGSNLLATRWFAIEGKYPIHGTHAHHVTLGKVTSQHPLGQLVL
jgi:hypothetical protein